jgi:hypothetical protein
MGSSRSRNSTRAAKARSVKRTTSSRHRAARPPDQSKPRIPPAIEIAIDDQRKSIETAISLLYCLHSALRREIDDAGRVESEAVEDASQGADLTDISAMLLVRLNAIHIALDSVALEQAKVDPEMLRITEMACRLGTGSDEREAS